jgi:aspartate/methionine/tyrosine aminotransferase
VKAPLSEFLMEDWLERHRFTAKFNAGESGHRPQSLQNVLSGLQPDFNFDLRDALHETLLCDAPNMGMDELRFEVARLHAGAGPENVLITTGTSEALILLLRQLRPKRVALITPAFQLLSEIPRSLGASVLYLPLLWDVQSGKPQAPLEQWIATLTRERPDVFIFNHPHNPSGLTFTGAEREALLNACESIGCVVIGDEHYRFLAVPESDTSRPARIGPTIWNRGSGRFVTGSFIKCAGTAGLRVGWCVGDEKTLAAMQSEKNYLTHTVNPLSQQLSIWFLQSFARHQSFFKPLFDEWQSNRMLLKEWLDSSADWTGASPEGGLVSCIFPRTAKHPSEIFENIRRKGVFLLPLSSFMETDMTDGAFSHGFRLGLGLRTSILKEMISVMVLNIP